jgi:hypothetical protein
MATSIEAVVAALKVALREAEHGEEVQWEARAANRWIDLLPGAYLGRWRHLKLSDGLVSRSRFVGHLRATLAYLDAFERGTPVRRYWWQPPARVPKQAALPPAATSKPAATTRPVNLLRVRKPMPGVH